MKKSPIKRTLWLFAILSLGLSLVSMAHAGAAAHTAELRTNCEVQHETSKGTFSAKVEVLFTAASPEAKSTLIADPTSPLFRIGFERSTTNDAAVFITIRGAHNYVRFADDKENYLNRKTGLDGFGVKRTLAGQQLSTNFRFGVSSGLPGDINLYCRVEASTGKPLALSKEFQETESRASRGVSEVSFTRYED